MKAFAPLHNFATQEKYFEFSDYLSLKVAYELNYQYDNSGNFISKYELNDVSICHNWVIIDLDKINLEDEIILNTLLIAFWIYSSNKISFKYIFNDYEQSCYKNFSRFEFNEKDINKSEYTLYELTKIKEYFNLLVSITQANGRVHTAISNTFQGCVAFNWKTAFLLYSAAIEALLTYKRGYGITKRLSKSYACLVETDFTKRKQEYTNFSDLYKIRSYIMHGSINDSSPDDNLINLSKFADVLRKLWQTILSDSNIVNILEKQDSDRGIFFNKLETGFSP